MVDYISMIKDEKNINKKYFYRLLMKFRMNEKFVEGDNIFCLLHILNEVVLECNGNNLKNTDNNKMLTQKLEFILKNPYLIMDDNRNEVQYLKMELYNKNEDVVKSITEQILTKISTKKFFDNLVNSSVSLLNDSKNNNTEKIKLLFENIIIHLLYMGYSFKTIIKKIEALFSKSIIQEDIELSFPSTNFPLEYVDKNMTKQEKNDYINNLSFDDRFNLVKKLFLTKTKTFYFITIIHGITLNQKTFKPNEDIILYNPKETKLYPLCYDEDIFSQVDYKKSVNVSIRVKAICRDTVAVLAKNKLDNYINIIKTLTPTNNIGMSNKQTIILNDKKELCSSMRTSYEDEFEKRTFERSFIAIREEQIFHHKNIFNNDICFLLSNQTIINKSYQILLNSIKKFSEGIEAKNAQEAILKFWSALECLFDNNLKINDKLNKYDLIKLVVPKHTVLLNKYVDITDLYNTLHRCTCCDYKDKTAQQSECTLEIPIHILKRVELITDKKTISLKKLALNCDKILNYCENDIFIKNKVVYINNLYKNNNFAYKSYKDQICITENHLAFIYRLRNQIIHNANSNEITTKFYLPILKKITVNFINSIINEMINDRTLDINQIITKIYTKDQITLNKLENNTLFDISFENNQ